MADLPNREKEELWQREAVGSTSKGTAMEFGT